MMAAVTIAARATPTISSTRTRITLGLLHLPAARTSFAPEDGRDKRMAAVRAMQVGDLIYIPGHVMMYIGDIDGMPYVIHDTNGGSYLGADGKPRSLGLNGVSVTPLLPLRFGKDHDYVDRITNIVKVAAAQ